jgi:hypothetical protein
MADLPSFLLAQEPLAQGLMPSPDQRQRMQSNRSAFSPPAAMTLEVGPQASLSDLTQQIQMLFKRGLISQPQYDQLMARFGASQSNVNR